MCSRALLLSGCVASLVPWSTIAALRLSAIVRRSTTGGTPRDIVMKINAEVKKIMSDPDFQKRFMAPQMFESMATDPDTFDKYIKAETQRWGKVIREQKLTIQ